MKLTQEEAAKYLPLVQAAAEGKTIQYQGSDGHWNDMRECFFDCPIHLYRIKPEPKLRKWRREEVPVGALLKRKGGTFFGLILGSGENGVLFPSDENKLMEISFEYCYQFMIYSTDGGKTWKPCGVEE